jgi:hypothetical protein
VDRETSRYLLVNFVLRQVGKGKQVLLLCERETVGPVTANRGHIAAYMRELMSRPHHRAASVVAIGSGGSG